MKLITTIKCSYQALPKSSHRHSDQEDLNFFLCLSIGLLIAAIACLLMYRHDYHQVMRAKTAEHKADQYQQALRPLKLKEKQMELKARNNQIAALIKVNQLDPTIGKTSSWQEVNQALTQGQTAFPLDTKQLIFAIDGTRMGCGAVVTNENCLRFHPQSANLIVMQLINQAVPDNLFSLAKWQQEVRTSNPITSEQLLTLVQTSARQENELVRINYKIKQINHKALIKTHALNAPHMFLYIAGFIFIFFTLSLVSAFQELRAGYKLYQQQLQNVPLPRPACAPAPSAVAPLPAIKPEPDLEPDESRSSKRYTAEEIFTQRRAAK